MINYLKNLFKKEPDDYQSELTSSSIFKYDEKLEKNFACESCEFFDRCKYAHSSKNSKYSACECTISCIEPYNAELGTIVIIDDNPGIVSFLKDDIEELTEELNIKKNILTVSGSHAAYCLESFIETNKMKIESAIIDITLGGTMITDEKVLKYTGVDVYKMCIENNKDLEYVFYTGNNLNPYIKSNNTLMDYYHKLTGKDINEKVLFKTSLSLDDRRTKLKKLIKGN